MMSKLLEWREWLDFKEAARYLGKKINEDSLTDQDVIRLALEKEITVSINFLSFVSACDYTKFPVPSEELHNVSFFDDDDDEFDVFQDMQTIAQDMEELERWNALESINTIDVKGIFDLEMRGDVVRHLKKMCGDIVGDSRRFSSEPDVYFMRNDKRFYLLERLGPDKNQVFPNDCQLIIQRKEIDRFIETIQNKESQEKGGKQMSETGIPEKAKMLTARERNTFLIIIAALLNELKVDPLAKGTAAYLAKLTEDIAAPISEETILDKLRQISNALERRMK